MLSKFVSRFLITSLLFLSCLIGNVDSIYAGTIQQVLLSEVGTVNNSTVTAVQPVIITIAAGSTSGTAAITSVNTSLSAVFYNGATYPANITNPSELLAGVQLTSATVVTATRNTADASNAEKVYATVVTFNSAAISNIQQGSTALTSGATSNTSSITSVTTTNSAIIYDGSITAITGSTQAYFMNAAQLTGASTVTVSRGAASGAETIYWTVISFNSGYLNSATQASSVVGASTGQTATITGVTAANTMLFYGGESSASTGSSAWCNSQAITLTNGTTVTETMGNSPVSATTSYFTVVEFKSANINSMNRAVTTVVNPNQTTSTTITSVNTAKTFNNFLGNSTTATTSFLTSNIWTQTNLASATSSVIGEGATQASGNNTWTGWETVEFK